MKKTFKSPLSILLSFVIIIGMFMLIPFTARAECEQHNLTYVAAVEATDLVDGNIAYYKCSECGKYFSDADGENEITSSSVVIDAKKLFKDGKIFKENEQIKIPNKTRIEVDGGALQYDQVLTDHPIKLNDGYLYVYDKNKKFGPVAKIKSDSSYSFTGYYEVAYQYKSGDGYKVYKVQPLYYKKSTAPTWADWNPGDTTTTVTLSDFYMDTNPIYNSLVTSSIEFTQIVDATIDEGEVTIAPTYDTEGVRTYTATAKAYHLTVTDTRDEVVPTAPEERLEGHSISLDGDIGVSFYMQLNDTITSDADAYMHFTIPSGDTTVEKDVPVSDATVDGSYYVFKCSVAAKEIKSTIKAQIFSNDEGYTEYTYSVQDYADYLINNADENGTDVQKSYAEAKPLVEALLTYGENAAYYFDDTADQPENIDTVISEYSYTVHDTLPAGVGFTGATLSLKSTTTLSLYFCSDSEIMLTCEGKDTEVSHNGSEYVIRVPDISAKDLNRSITVKVNGADAVTYSPLAYCYKAQQKSGNTALVNTVKALYLYWVEADKYFD